MTVWSLSRDWRASFDPASAERRLSHYSELRTALTGHQMMAELQGVPFVSTSVEHKLSSLLDAQIAFARAQIAQVAERVTAPDREDQASEARPGSRQ